MAPVSSQAVAPSEGATSASCSALEAAARKLAALDEVLSKLYERHGVPTLEWPDPGGDQPVAIKTAFEALARSIVYQQLAGKAAAAIHSRLVAGLGNVSSRTVLDAGPTTLQGFGLSRSKASALVDLAEQVNKGLLRLDELSDMSDEDVVKELVQVRGIGRWTAEMFLIFYLGRFDVWPCGDYGVRVGFAKAWGLGTVPQPRALGPLADRFRPYRSLVAWYCWRAAEDTR